MRSAYEPDSALKADVEFVLPLPLSLEVTFMFASVTAPLDEKEGSVVVGFTAAIFGTWSFVCGAGDDDEVEVDDILMLSEGRQGKAL